MNTSVQSQPKKLTESHVLITGGTAGVGLATAIQFAEAGVKGIAINGRNEERGEKARQEVLSRCPDANVIFIAGDSNIPAEAERVCNSAWEQFGSIEIVVNSTVGPYGPTLLKDIDPKEIGSILDSQLLAPLLISRIMLPLMTKNGGGVITNIASDAGKHTTPGETVLGAAMAGIMMFTRAMAMEVKRNGIRVNVITPSIIEGTLTNQAVMNQPFGQKLFSKAIEAARLGVVLPEDMADMIVFLSSEKAGKVTGQMISVNGGISA